MTIFNAIHRTLKNALKTFYEKIRPIIADVNTFAIDDGIQGVTSQLTILSDDIREYFIVQPYASVRTYQNVPGNRPSYTAPPIQLSFSSYYGLPQPSVNFTGQRQYLDAIWRLLNTSQSNLALSQQGQRRAVLYGMGGIGKTQILLKFINDQISGRAHPKPYNAAIWINAASDVTIKNDILSFMEVNGFREKLEDDQGNTRYAPFHARLQHDCKHWILIFDNVKDYDHVRKAIPQTNTGHVLFSTRYRVIAEQLAPHSKPVEVLPMDTDNAINLALSLAERSERDSDKTNDVAQAVADFARGLPLQIEQIINNAILAQRTVIETLDRVRDKRELLKQKNRSSLYEDNLSQGAIVLQHFELLSSKFPSAEALFKIIVYFEPSSIPYSIFSDARGRLSAFLDRPDTYIRGALDLKAGNIDRIAALHQAGTIPRKNIGERYQQFLSSLRKSKSKQMTCIQDHLPVDDAELSAAVKRECGKGTVLGELLENQIVLQNAIMVLIDLSVVRKLNDNELWMHDLTSEVAKAVLLSLPNAPASNMALTAATMVYTIFPTPSRIMTGLRELRCRKYLPHAISCQENLRDVGILNDCSTGPELSHLIASTLDSLSSVAYDESGAALSKGQEQQSVTRVIGYYRAAYQGYMAGWRRLKVDYGISDQAIFSHSCFDRFEEAIFQPYYADRYTRDCERLGCNAPWRAIQTACKLAHWLQKDPATIDQAIAFSNAALKFYRLAFGVNDEDTIHMKTAVYEQLSSAGQWQEAYDLSMQSFKEKVGWRVGDHKHNATITLERVSLDGVAAAFARDLGTCCMALSEASSLSPAEVQRLATEAAMWYEIEVRMLHTPRYGQDEYYGVPCYTRYAKAYERARCPHAALFWFGRAVFCALAQMIWEHEEWNDGPGYGAVNVGAEHHIQDTVATFEAAVDRLLVAGEGKLGRLEDLDLDFKKFLTVVNWKIEYWREDREIYGVWDPYKEAADKLQREFDEREEEIRKQEEELYGEIPPLHEVVVEEDEDKENEEELHIEYSLTELHGQDAVQEVLARMDDKKLTASLRERELLSELVNAG